MQSDRILVCMDQFKDSTTQHRAPMAMQLLRICLISSVAALEITAVYQGRWLLRRGETAQLNATLND